MKTTHAAFVVALGVALTGCATDPVDAYIEAEESRVAERADAMSEMLEDMPDWYLQTPPSNDEGSYASAMASANDLQYAIDKAKLMAEFGIAKQINQVVSGRERMFRADSSGSVGDTSDQTILKRVERADVVGHRVVDTKVMVSPNARYVAFVLIHLPFDAQQKVLGLRDKAIIADATRAYEDVERHDEAREQVRNERVADAAAALKGFEVLQ